MRLDVKRKWFTEKSTIGELYVNGIFQCYTLEDVVRAPGVKVDGKTAIPMGTYNVAITDSVRFKRPMPQLLDVPHFGGIRIHAGNTDADTEGCLLVGYQRTTDFIGSSRAAFAELFQKLTGAVAKCEAITIVISTAQDAQVLKAAAATAMLLFTLLAPALGLAGCASAKKPVPAQAHLVYPADCVTKLRVLGIVIRRASVRWRSSRYVAR